MSIIRFCDETEAYGCFSNFYPVKFTFEGVEYPTLEHFMQYQKAITFGDNATAQKILKANVDDAKDLGRQVTPYIGAIWEGRRQLIVYRGLLEKFRQNPDICAQLLSTGDSIIVESTDEDLLWGNGLDIKDPDNEDVSKWKGDNLLGFTLMEVRKTLQAEQAAK